VSERVNAKLFLRLNEHCTMKTDGGKVAYLSTEIMYVN